MLFDDFVEREHYHFVKQLFEPVEIIGERMAVFKVRPKKVSSRLLLENMHYFLDPRSYWRSSSRSRVAELNK
ncbi:hypothetical protein D3C84_1243760 [compost metagenome]